MTPEQQYERLARGTEEILPEGDLLRRLAEAARVGRPLRVKQGFDPTAPDIHLGHAVGLRKLREFQDLGHQVVLIVGDYTGRVGDPSGRNKTRPQLTAAEVDANATTYMEQFYRVLLRDPAPPLLPVEVHRNGEWFAPMRFEDVIRLCSKYTVARLLERDDFAKRYAANQPIAMHELFYPIMQGHDSVAIRSDVEIGGTEQKFNLLVGRALQEADGQPPQIVLTLPILLGLDGKLRMSKSLGNYVGVIDPPAEMFGKLMSIPDSALGTYWELVSGAPPEELDDIRRALADPNVNPMNIKKRLGERIVCIYHGEQAGERARLAFEAQFSRREIPEDLESFSPAALVGVVKDPERPLLLEFVIAAGFADSRGAARRLITQGAVSLDGVRILDPEAPGEARGAFVLRAGRRMKRYLPG